MTPIDIDPSVVASWHNTKMLDFIPPHFTTVEFRHINERRRTLNWLFANANGRFAIAEVHKQIAHTEIITETVMIGFEDSADATAYVLFYK